MSATDKYCRWRFFYAYWLNEPAFLITTQRFFPVPPLATQLFIGKEMAPPGKTPRSLSLGTTA
jgi:hypothetical protein